MKKSAAPSATPATAQPNVGKFPDKYHCPVVMIEVNPATKEGDLVMAANYEGRQYGPYRVARVLNCGENQLTTFAMCLKEPKVREVGASSSGKVNASSVAEAQMKVILSLAEKLGVSL